MKPEKVSKIFAACAILHNIAKSRSLPDFDGAAEDGPSSDDAPDDTPVGLGGSALHDFIATTHFG